MSLNRKENEEKDQKELDRKITGIENFADFKKLFYRIWAVGNNSRRTVAYELAARLARLCPEKKEIGEEAIKKLYAEIGEEKWYYVGD